MPGITQYQLTYVVLATIVKFYASNAYVCNRVRCVQNEETVISLLLAEGNCASGACGDNSFAKLLVVNDALISLQPAVLNSNLIIAVKASYTIACLASEADFREVIEQSGALNVIEEVLQVRDCCRASVS